MWLSAKPLGRAGTTTANRGDNHGGARARQKAQSNAQLGSVASLESASLATTGCADARTALDALQENHFDVIVLDIGLPDMNGLDMCDHIHALPKHGQTPIVFLSSDDSEHNRERGVIKGATEFIAKPCNMFELTLKAHTWALKNRLDVA